VLLFTYRPKGPKEREKMTPDYKRLNELNDKAKEIAEEIKDNLDTATDWHYKIHLDNAEKLLKDFKKVFQLLAEETKKAGL
jgi:uncharacterized coiled-coil DUF342 family protein